MRGYGDLFSPLWPAVQARYEEAVYRIKRAYSDLTPQQQKGSPTDVIMDLGPVIIRELQRAESEAVSAMRTVLGPYRSSEEPQPSPMNYSPDILWFGKFNDGKKERSVRLVKCFTQVRDAIVELRVFEYDAGPDRMGASAWVLLDSSHYAAVLAAVATHF